MISVNRLRTSIRNLGLIHGARLRRIPYPKQDTGFQLCFGLLGLASWGFGCDPTSKESASQSRCCSLCVVRMPQDSIFDLFRTGVCIKVCDDDDKIEHRETNVSPSSPMDSVSYSILQ